MKKYEQLFWKLFKANGETEVSCIIGNNNLLNNISNWWPYGNNKGNFGTFENQQSHPVPSLVEKITNSIDTIWFVLALRTFKKKIPLKSR